VPDLLTVVFFALSTAFLAASVAYVANAIPGQLFEGRPMYLARGYITHPLARSLVVLAETGVIAMFAILTFGVATEADQLSSFNAVINWLAVAFETVVIIRMLVRVSRSAFTR
jgi:hypothetical protein